LGLRKKAEKKQFATRKWPFFPPSPAALCPSHDRTAATVGAPSPSKTTHNLGTTAGATVLYQRIRGAAGQVCGVSSDRDLARGAQAKACAAHAVADAVAAVNAPALTSIYQATMGGTAVTRLAVNR